MWAKARAHRGKSAVDTWDRPSSVVKRGLGHLRGIVVAKSKEHVLKEGLNEARRKGAKAPSQFHPTTSFKQETHASTGVQEPSGYFNVLGLKLLAMSVAWKLQRQNETLQVEKSPEMSRQPPRAHTVET